MAVILPLTLQRYIKKLRKTNYLTKKRFKEQNLK